MFSEILVEPGPRLRGRSQVDLELFGDFDQDLVHAIADDVRSTWVFFGFFCDFYQDLVHAFADDVREILFEMNEDKNY